MSGGGGGGIILLACGSFNPLTIMHLRMFELAKGYLNRVFGSSSYVIGGIISPVNNAYGKKGLVDGRHRVEMCRLGCINNDWIKVSNWEVEGKTWSRTCEVLRYHQEIVNQFYEGSLKEVPSWLPDSPNRQAIVNKNVQIKLLCGADVLESFNIPQLWTEEHMNEILRDYGLVVISRSGNDPEESIKKNKILSQFREENIHLIQEIVENNISSTKIRNAIKIGDSIRYLVPDPVIEYISKNHLYETNDNVY